MLTAIMLLNAGCSGINTGTTVSPASFFLPGIMKAEPPKADPSVLPVEIPKQYAAAR
jgi:hypothetical protein